MNIWTVTLCKSEGMWEYMKLTISKTKVFLAIHGQLDCDTLYGGTVRW